MDRYPSEYTGRDTGWVKPSTKKPPSFVLVKLRIKDLEEELPGWWTGCTWFGYRVKSDHVIEFWRYKSSQRTL
jgi:hypothetical protein